MNNVIRLIAKLLKKLLGEGFYRQTNVLGHSLEAWVAAAINGFPGLRLKVIGVTGTNGKTTSINYITSVLGAAGYKVGASTTANFRLGDEEWDNDLNATVTNPWALQKLLKRMLKERVDWVVLEVTSHALHQNRIAAINFDIAVMTNLSPDHLDYHGDMDSYAEAKAKLFKKAKQAAVLNHDDQWYQYFKDSAFHAVYSYGTNKDSDVRLEKMDLKTHSSHIRFRYGERIMELDLQLPGKFNVYNGLAAATVAFGLELDHEQVKEGLEYLTGVPGRMESIEAGQKFGVIVDYAHTPDAFKNVLENLRDITKGNVIAVFGGAPTHDYQGLGEEAGRLADKVIVTDDEPMDEDPASIRKTIYDAAVSQDHAKTLEIADRFEALEKAFAMAADEDVVILLCLGHQKYRRVGKGKRIEWDDRQMAKTLLEKMK
ncbi:MAG: UDP-N-acetylmuramoyl-L-alanyl-D-glutamate--2,6-diaminopimelate ligase [Candidatus Saccharimonadales bacterium]